MKRERLKRRVLYGVTAFAWLVSGHFIWAALHYESEPTLVGLLVGLVVAATLSTASLFSVFVAPLETVYRHGYEAAERAAIEQQYQPQRRARAANSGAVVVPLRVMNR